MDRPTFLYGTAWKEDDTERLTALALRAGFRGIDTANQRKHYHEAGVGAALRRAIADGVVTRAALFIQTKFTSPGGQDHRLPYDRDADPATQVRQSFARSLDHLGTHVDSYVLHGPTTRSGLAEYDRAVWREMEALRREGKVRQLGVSNVTLEQLELLCAQATIAPAFVQNRCYARSGWDREVRAFCTAHAIIYQPFSLLTANDAELRSARFRAVAESLRPASAAQIVFRFAMARGMLPLTGTISEAHMREDLACAALTIPEAALAAIDEVGRDA